MIKSRILRWKDYFRLSMQVLNAITMSYDRQRELNKRESNVKTETEIKMIHPEAKIACSQQNLEEAGTGLSPRAFIESVALQTP